MKRSIISVSHNRFSWKVIGLLGVTLLVASCQLLGPEPTPTATLQMTSTATPLPSPTKTTTPLAPTPTKLPGVQGEVTIWVDWAQQELTTLFAHLEAFQDRFPEIQISLSYYPTEELLDRFQAAAIEGEEPTILIGPVDWSEQLISDGSIRDVHGRISEDFLETFHPVALDGVVFNQGVYGLPLFLEGVLLYRNQDLISETPKTLDDLVDLAGELQDEGTVGIQLDLGFLQTGGFLPACDGELLGADGELSLTLRSGECWLEILQQMRLAGPVTINTDDDLERFEAGQAAWLIDGSWNAARILESLGEEKVSIDPWPVYSPTGKEIRGYAWSRNIFFSASADEQDFNAAWILARYLLTPEVQEDFALMTFGQHVPVLKSVPTMERWLQELMVTMGMNIPLPRYPEFSIFIEHLEIAAVDVARRGYDPYFVIRWEHLNIEKDLRFRRAGRE